MTVGVARGGPAEADVERNAARGRVRGDLRHRRVVRAEEADALDPPVVEVGVEEVAVRADLQVDRVRGSRDEGLAAVRVREPGAAREHGPDAVARVVGEEERSQVARGVVAAVVEGQSGDRGASRWAALAVHDRGGVAVGVVREPDCRRSGAIEVLADVQVRAVVTGLAPVALVAGPPEVVDGGVGDRAEVVDLLPVVPADVTDPDVVRARADREPEGVAEAVGDDPAGVGVGAEPERVAREGSARGLVDAQHGAVERDRVRRRAQVLAPQGAALGRGRCQGAAAVAGRVAAGVERVPVLSPVREVEARAVAAAHVERAVRAERELADRVTRVLLAPVLDQHLLRSGRDAVGGADREAREPAADDAPVGGRAVQRRARVRVDAGRPEPWERRDRRLLVVGVEDVDVRLGRVVRVDGQAEHPPVPEVVGVGRQVDRRRRRAVVQAVERLDQAALLGDERTAVGSEPECRRIREAREDVRLLEVGLKRRGARVAGNGKRGRGDQGERENAPPQRQESPPAHVLSYLPRAPEA